MTRIPEIFNQDNIVYHYTKTQNVIEHILFQKKLRLSPRVNSIDPIENTKPLIMASGVGYADEPIVDEGLRSEAIEKINQAIVNTKQLCFCMNNNSISIENHSIIPHEYYGFLKPRMWDQYGDHYKGVCLAFDLTKLKKATEFINKPIDYVDYKSILYFDTYFSLNELAHKRIDYCEEYLSSIKDLFFRKHKDYIGENEYRFLSRSENEYDYIDIDDSLVGIIVSKKDITEFALKNLEKYAEDHHVKVLYIQWHERGISFASKN